MTYADVLTNAAVLDPHAWSDANVWTVALDATEARRRGRSSGKGFSVGGLILCLGVVVVVIGLVIWLSKRGKSNSNQPQQPYPPQQYPQPYPPQQDYPAQQQYQNPPQYQQPYPPQGQPQYQQHPPQQPYQPPYPPQR
ncbi:hypothetical protein OHA40_28430 [Nocardia sp. NBC_00508]|uniref:hypothetical protein n=1 Tax=Nocardia sp. NBC_00508 TaxID=2975992 RepID=UPI002E810277|nr:hypothetical protein [Nocardia sp. NBC_00508]WUD65511.1 hypothetical protein OHA40_28430 [Nocardia sp. NBC_00508]